MSDTLGAIPLGGTDEYGTRWVLAKLSGWESADATSPVVERAAADGGQWAPAWLQPRAIGLDEGWIIAPDLAGRKAAEDRLRQALPHDRDVALSIGGRTATVRRSSRLIVDRVNDTMVRWSVGLVAADPRLYGQTVDASIGLPHSVGGLDYPVDYPLDWPDVVAGNIAATNDGDTPTPIVAVVTGPTTTPALLDQTSGRVLEFDVAIVAGEQLVIDTLAGTAVLGGGDVVGHITPRSAPIEAFLLPPGVSTIGFRAASAYDAAATLHMSWTPAFSGG